MPDVNDMDLVREYASRGSEPAFAELIRRHINLVYSVALRFVGDSADAQDVTQVVFILLAKKSAGLSRRTILTGWLYETTRFTAAKFLRTASRRRAHEQEAYMQSILNESNVNDVWRRLAPHLEEAMTRLGERDRTLLALRFYENKSGAETAAMLGIQEQAAHKRTARALEKLRTFFAKRGIASTTAIIAVAISANSVQAAPVALAKSVTAVAITKGATASISTLTLIQGALKIMAWTKTQTAIVGVIIVGMAAISVIQHQAQVKLREQNKSLQQQINQLSQLKIENQDLSNLLAQASDSEANAKDQLNKLLPQRRLNKVPPASDLSAQPVLPTPKPDVELPKDSWSKAGFATPEATLKTRGWAVLNGDREQFAQSVSLTDGARKMIEDQLVQMASASKDPNAPALLQQVLNEKWGAEEAILMPMMAENQNNTYTDYKILSQQSPSPDEMIMEVETDMASAPSKTETLNFQRFGNDWKIVIDEAAVQNEMGH